MEKIRKYIGKIGRGIAITALAGCLALGSIGQAKAASISTEVMSGKENTVVDTKSFGQITDDFSLFARTRAGSYQGKTDIFSLLDLNYSIGSGVDAVFETQFMPGSKVIPRAGASYFGSFGDLEVYTLGTAKLREGSDLELVTNLDYTFPLRKDLDGSLGLETITGIEKSGPTFGIYRGRIGLDKSDYKFGVAVDAFQSGEDLDYHLGVFVKKDLK